MKDEVLTSVEASLPRRLFGVTMLLILGFLMFYLGISSPPASLLWLAFLLVIGGLALWLALVMWRATELRIDLTRTELRSSDGEIIALVKDVASMDRGMFAFKPSNGFILRLRSRAGRRWRPGLWWRMGRRVGVGGVTPGSQTRIMADMLAALVHERDG